MTLKAILHRSPRDFGKPSSVWTLELLAEVSYEQGLTEKKVGIETVRNVLHRSGIQWKRTKKRDDWAIGYQDETRWSRLTHPNQHTWTRGNPLRLVEQTQEKDDTQPKAFACYGIDLRWAQKEEVWLRFVEGNPKSEPTI